MADGKQGMMVLDLSQNPITQIQRKLNELDVGLKVWLSKQSVAVEAAAVTAAAAAQGAAMGGIMGTLTKDSSSSSFLSPPPSSLDPQAMPSLKQAQDPIPLTQVPMGPGALQDPPLVNLESSSSVELPLQPVISTMVVHQPAPSILNQDPHFEAMGGCNLPETTAPLVDSKDTSRPSSSTTPVVAYLEKTALAGGPLIQARNFAVMTGVNAGIACVMKRIRGKEDVQSSMVAGFGSGAMFSLVSGMGTPNQAANVVTTGIFFALAQGGLFKLGEKFKQSPDEDVCYIKTRSLLANLGLQNYEKNFKNSLLTDTTLPLLNDSALRDAKIPPGPRLLILDHIQRNPELKRKQRG